MSRRQRWLAAAAAMLAIAAQASAAVLGWQHIRPRLPALAAVAPSLDEAIASVVAAVGDSAAVAVSAVVPAASCQNTPLAKGNRFTRTADLYTEPGGEDTLIGTVAATLPTTQRPQRSAPIGGGAAPLDADLGGVHLRVSQLGTGWVTATAATGCRITSHGPPPAPSTPPGEATAALTQLLTALNTTPASWSVDTVSCPTGRIVTVDAISHATNTDNLPTRLASTLPGGTRQFASGSNRLAWREQTTSMIVAASDDGAHIIVQRSTTC